MRYCLLILLFHLFYGVTHAQKTKKPSYFYTASSEKYLSDKETDSLVYVYTNKLFTENAIPQLLFEKHYANVKSRLVPLSQNNIVLGFKYFERKQGKNINAAAGTAQYDSNKKAYREILDAQIRQTFQRNLSLSQYLYSSTSDRISSFNSTIRVGENGKLLVTERIRIYNGNGSYNPVYGNDYLLPEKGMMNDDIKRGIVRLFPTFYINKYKLFQNTTFKVKEVLRNGMKEEYHTEKKENGISLFTGNKYKFLQNGYYTYTITYETDHQLKFLKDYDELYWNVTGTGWVFRIDSASCTVILPKGATPLSSKCYTGRQGSTDENCSFSTQTVGDSTVVVFKTTKPLPSQNGITVAISWNKGYVKAPGFFKQVGYYIWNNRAVFLLPLAALFSFIFLFLFWLRYGRDPKPGIAYPLFEPPPHYSPAALGYIYFQKFSGQLTAATVVDAAVRNNVKIDVERDGVIFKHNEYVFSKSDKASKPTMTNYEDFSGDVKDLIGSRVEKGKYNSSLADLQKKVRQHCEDNYKEDKKKKKKGFFALNDRYLIFPGIICVAAGIWAFIELMIALVRKNYWQIGYYVLGIVLCSMVFKLFARLLKAYNPAGIKLRASIEGFRMFLAAADEKRFDMMNPPKKSLALYEKYLPFAIALDCEVEWGNKFEDIINTAVITGEGVSSFSKSYSRDNNSFSSSFSSSFSGAIASASTPPSSSSGGGSSFGGGSSGGGGGGGGGGGW